MKDSKRKKTLSVVLSIFIGIGIGVTIISAMIVYALQRIVTLNIPVIGNYVSDIVEIVQKRQY